MIVGWQKNKYRERKREGSHICFFKQIGSTISLRRVNYVNNLQNAITQWL